MGGGLQMWLWEMWTWVTVVAIVTLASTCGVRGEALSGESLNPTVGFLGTDKTLTIWQIPEGVPVKKILFVAHAGDDVGPAGFWDPHPNCPMCVGLPENRIIVIDAVSRGYAVIAISSVNPTMEWEAWPVETRDTISVNSVLSTWQRQYGLVNVPVVALGISAGGHLVCTLSLYPGLFEAVAIMISRGVQESWDLSTAANPPTLFMNMAKDTETAEIVSWSIVHLRSLGVPVAQVQTDEHPITDDWFHQRIPGLGIRTSKDLRAVLKDADIIDARDMVVLTNYDWMSLFRQTKALPEDPRQPGQLRWEPHVNQEIRLAEAKHTCFSQRNTVMFDWFEGDYQADVSHANS